MARFDDDFDNEYDEEGRRVMTLDDLLGPVPAPDPSVEQADVYDLNDFTNSASDAVSDKNPSKSQRVRDYLEEHPEARNRDVVDALGKYGVTAADVSNAKAQLKRKGDVPARRGRPPAATTANAGAIDEVGAGNLPTEAAPGGAIAMNDLEAAIKFVREIGSLSRAQQLLVIIQQLQRL